MGLEDVPAIVCIHMASFENFFLTFLGPAFLKQLYIGTLNDSSGIAIVAEIDNKICGFVTGTATPSGFYRRLIVRRWWRFGLACVIPTINRPIIIPRLIRAFTMPGQSAKKNETGTLMSIAVIPEALGKGLGKALVLAFLEETRQRGVRKVDLTTDAVRNEEVVRFYEDLGFVCEREFRTPEGRMMKEYVIEIG